jgi:hypothetical protein
MSILTRSSLLCLLFIYCSIGYTDANGDIQERIVKTTEEIKKHPDSAYLYLRWGKLYYQHEEFNKSFSNLKDSQKSRYYLSEQQLLFAKVHTKSYNLSKALIYIDIVLETEPNYVTEIRLKASIFYREHKYKIAALSFEYTIAALSFVQVLHISKATIPENYIEASLAWKNLNSAACDSNAIIVIRKRIENLGNTNRL